jgi:hypothetical protein
MSTKNEKPQNKLQSAFSLFGPSIEAFKINPVVLLVFLLVPNIITSFPITEELQHKSAPMLILQAFAGIAMVAVCFLFGTALTASTLASAQGKKINLQQSLDKAFHFFWRFVGLTILIGLIVVVGLILLIVPGIFMIRRYILAPYYMIDRDLGIMDTLRLSAKESRALPWPLWGLVGVELLLTLPIIIPFVGIFIAVGFQVVYACAPAIRYGEYKKLKLSPEKLRPVKN